MTDERIAEIRARLEALKSGWLYDDGIHISVNSDYLDIMCHDVDYDFIANAPEDIDILLKHIDALQAQIEKFEEKLSDMEDDARGRWV